VVPTKKTELKHLGIEGISRARKSNKKEKQEEQQKHLRNHAKPSIDTMKDSYKV
jgi:hypothetical protein